MKNVISFFESNFLCYSDLFCLFHVFLFGKNEDIETTYELWNSLPSINYIRLCIWLRHRLRQSNRLQCRSQLSFVCERKYHTFPLIPPCLRGVRQRVSSYQVFMTTPRTKLLWPHRIPHLRQLHINMEREGGRERERGGGGERKRERERGRERERQRDRERDRERERARAPRLKHKK